MIDIYNDPGHGRLQHLFGQFPKLAVLVKKASVSDDGGSLPSTAFAWPSHRRFPVHTPKMAALSYAYASTQEGVPREVLAQIKEALDAYQVADDTFAQAAQKVADAPDGYIFQEQRLYPARNAAEVKQAEARLLEQVRKFAADTRAEAFARLQEKAREHKVALEPLSLKYAGLTETDPGILRDQLRARAAATPDEALKEAYGKLASEVSRKARDLRLRPTQVKMAAAIQELDERAGLVAEYDLRLLDPIVAVFNMEKIAEPGVELGGKRIPLSRLAAVDSTTYGDILGPDFLREITTSSGDVDPQKLLEVLDTLPADLKRSLSKVV